MSRATSGFASTSTTPTFRACADSAGFTKPLISIIGMSGWIIRSDCASSEPVMSGIDSSDSTAWKRSGVVRNPSNAATLDVKPTGS